ncbi:S-adenosyl-L-methionine-dependent methyltransferase [Stereum hirsutum FP-91666 SS1]|uniref:S-adenosyl-L-methionine-dependent methyltransferase n=1 Tax=Stereum hirsutum (strain FP-91666) TaxID=721885 RepID=UPI000440EBF2|nr:S-adenosyl-L-methionine-dependent methyltransferase [Stereum hirsutum FP-91666 SS1]EIM88233.1 S-adenosyl-L-methionine-dependent methyltransferase [Stereum hirsutum FP-91666 SS1]
MNGRPSNAEQRYAVKKFVKEQGVDGWEEAWRRGITPWENFDGAQPPLRDLIVSARVPFKSPGRALVPGCGRGLDAIYIASSLGVDTLGIDISPSAVAAAKAQLSRHPQAIRDPGKVTFEELDFFKLTVPEDERFDIVYDYTFFCAIPPSRRKEWGQQITALTTPDAYLVTLLYPLSVTAEDGGPPYHMRRDHYKDALPGWKRAIDEQPKASSPGHEGEERLMVWRKVGLNKESAD